MKKLLLLSISAMMSLGAMAQVTEPTVTQNWQSQGEVEIPAQGDARYGTGFGGNVYVNNKAKSELYCYSYDDENKVVTRTTIDGIAYAVHAATVDGSGNIILPKNFSGASSMSGGVYIYNPTTKEGKEITYTMPEGYVSARMDYIGRAAGNVFKEDGGALFYLGATVINGVITAADTRVLKITIKNGSEATTEAVIDTEKQWSSATIVTPLTNDPSSNNIIIRGRNVGTSSYQYLNETQWVDYKKVGSLSTTAGGDAVVLGGKLYTIEPAIYGATTYLDGWQIVDRSTNTLVYESKEKTDVRSKDGSSTALFVEKVSETKAYIYHYHPGAYVAMYTFEVPADVDTAIESVEVAAGAVEYYNLQGVKVANPENGLFIKKQGNKVSKVVL